MDTDLLNTTTHNCNNNNGNHDHGTWIPRSNGHIIFIGSYSSNNFTDLVATYHHQQLPPILSLSQTTLTTFTSNESYNQSSISTSWTRLVPDLHGTSQGNSFEFSVAISHDGSRMSIGIPLQSNNHPKEEEDKLANVTASTGQVQ
eukprot:915863-Ditylum_brightwellii.AAC.1